MNLTTDGINAYHRYLYWKCSNPEDMEFTLVIRTPDIDESDLLQHFDDVEKGEGTLPGWRLYRALKGA